MNMTSAVIVTDDYLYELGCTDEFQVIGLNDQIIIVKDSIGHYIGFIMQGDPKTLWLIDLAEIAGRCLMTHVEAGTLYSDDPAKDGIKVELTYAIIE